MKDTRRGRRFGRTNIIAAKCNGAILAPKTYKHTTNNPFFLDWFEYDLLSLVPCGFTIIMDNASFNTKKELEKISKRYGVNLLFLPVYSPDFNPIENFWANLKQWLQDNIYLFNSPKTAILHYCVRFLC